MTATLPLQDNLYLVIISGIASLIYLDYWDVFFVVLDHQGVVSTVYDEKVCGENIEGIELSVYHSHFATSFF